jgi:hypothetical protein
VAVFAFVIIGSGIADRVQREIDKLAEETASMSLPFPTSIDAVRSTH